MSSKYNNYLSDEEKSIILKMHNEGYNTVKIADAIGRNNTSIGRFLAKNGLKVHNNKCSLLENDKKRIIEMYANGMTAKQILPFFIDKVKSENKIMSIVKSVGINRKGGIISDANIDYFEKIDTEAKAYYLGLFLSDGNVHRLKRNTEQYVIQIALQNKDVEIIKKFKEELHSSNKIYYYKKRDECHFSISSIKMAYDLIDKGVIPRKTFFAELNYSAVPQRLFRHYVRGIFDGDGTVYISKGRLSFGFYGTHKLVTQVQDWLIEQINIPKHKIFDKETVSFTTYQRQQDILNFYNLMYQDATFYIQRKKDKFDEYFNSIA